MQLPVVASGSSRGPRFPLDAMRLGPARDHVLSQSRKTNKMASSDVARPPVDLEYLPHNDLPAAGGEFPCQQSHWRTGYAPKTSNNNRVSCERLDRGSLLRTAGQSGGKAAKHFLHACRQLGLRRTRRLTRWGSLWWGTAPA